MSPNKAGLPNSTLTNPLSPTLSAKKPWYKSKWALAAHIFLAYAGISYYVNGIVKEEQRKRDAAKSIHPSDTAPSSHDIRTHSSYQDTKTPNDQSEDTKSTIPPSIFSAKIFDSLAPKYDEKIGYDEFVMGLPLFRRYLISKALGDVLEVSCGTGRNLKYYPSTKKISSVTFVDSSYPMLEKTVARFNTLSHKFLKQSAKSLLFNPFGLFTSSESQEAKQTSKAEIPSAFYHMNVCNMDFPDNSFDTVIDTFGLCSVGADYGSECLHDGLDHSKSPGHPIAALNEMARVCRPDGLVLLLEHGKGTYGFINAALVKNDDKHFEKWGCWYNRDIEELVRRSDLEIIYRSRWHFGTTYYIIARPKKAHIYKTNTVAKT